MASQERKQRMLYLAEYTPTVSKEDKMTEHELGRKLLRHALKQEYGRTFDVCVGKRGKPYLKDANGIFFNISHTRGIVVCGLAECRIGVDVERVRRFNEAVVRKACSQREQDYIFSGADERDRAVRFCRIWTLKESYIKAIGKGLAFPMQDITFQIGEKGICSNIPGWDYEQFPYGEEYMVAVCLAHNNRTESCDMKEKREITGERTER